MKLGITQFVLALSLFCNPMAGLAVTTLDVFKVQSSASGPMPCQMDMQQSQTTDHAIKSELANPMDYCNSDDCSMDPSCQSCLNLQVQTMLLETFELRFFIALQHNLEKFTGHIATRPILPEIHPPASSCLS